MGNCRICSVWLPESRTSAINDMCSRLSCWKQAHPELFKEAEGWMQQCRLIEIKCPNCGAQKSPWGVKEGDKLMCQFCWHGQLGEWIYKEAEGRISMSSGFTLDRILGIEESP